MPLLSVTSVHQLADEGRVSILERLDQPSPMSMADFTVSRRLKSGGATDCSYLLIRHKILNLTAADRADSRTGF